MRHETWDIPGSYDMGAVTDARAYTYLEVIMKVRGGALPPNTAILIHFMETQLNKMGQLQMDVSDANEPKDFHELLRMDRIPKPQSEDPRRFLSIKLDRGLLVPQDGQLYEINTVNF